MAWQWRVLAVQTKYVILVVVTTYASVAGATDVPEYLGEEIVVTASRVSTHRTLLPASVSVISADTIAQLPVRTVQELLETQAGIHVFSSSGAADSRVDLRGFGMTASSNTLILIDGIRANTNDSAPPTLSQILLTHIERIEVIRGSGAVQYGGGTTGGLINIITKSVFREGLSGQIALAYGTHQRQQLNTQFSFSKYCFSFDGYAKSLIDNHYRKNNIEHQHSAGLGVSWRASDGMVRIYARDTRQTLQLPGARTIDAVRGINEYANDRRGAATPNDVGSLALKELGLQAEQGFAQSRVLIDMTERVKKTLTSAWGGEDERTLNEWYGSVRWQWPAANRDQLVLGYDWLNGTADHRQGSPLVPFSAVTQSRRGLFVEGKLAIGDASWWSIGGRDQRIDDSFETRVIPVVQQPRGSRHLHAWETGLQHQIAEVWTVYGKLGQSFRVPNSDELAWATSVLRPQRSHDKEIGLAWENQNSRINIAAYRYNLTDEIHFNPLLYRNTNLQPTRRQGIEWGGATALGNRWRGRANLTWQRATFRSGQLRDTDLTGKTVPMVPSLLANLFLDWQANLTTRLSVALNYVGQQHFDNDEQNQFYNRLPHYVTVNAKVLRQLSKSAEVAFDVRNVFDEQYARYGVISVAEPNRYTLYPAERRTVSVSMRLTY